MGARASSVGVSCALVLCGLTAAGVAAGCGGDQTMPEPEPQPPAAGGSAAPDAAAQPTQDAAVEPSDADAARADAGPADAATDAARTDAGAEPTDPTVFVMPETLADTGLYRPGGGQELADGVMAFEPEYPLWSDGATKRRFLWLPPGEAIDTSDMDAWVFPLGTKAWKEFSRDDKRLETRLLWKTASGWFMTAFAWDDAETTAPIAMDGVLDARGTAHDIPNADDCGSCHDGQPDKLLGVSAIQLSHDRAPTNLRWLATQQRLSTVSPTSEQDYRLPTGEPWQALGYLHANCGSCHGPGGTGEQRVDMLLWLEVATLSDVTQTPTYLTTVGVELEEQDEQEADVRVVPGSPQESGIVERMTIRGAEIAMPPLASELVDDEGVELVTRFIEGLSQ